MSAYDIEFCDVSMSYPVARRFRFMRQSGAPVIALRNLNLAIESRERVAVFGENGAGKSTFLRLIAGMLIPSGGRVLVGGRDVTAGNARSLRKVGFVFAEERSFYWRLTGIENLRFFAALENLFGSTAEAEARRLLDAVGLAADGLRPVAEYSTGMRQRLALARGLLARPEILLLDEPTRSLDPTGTEAIHALLNSGLVAHCTLVLATNRFEDAANLCTRVTVLREGHIVADKRLPERPALDSVATFVRSELSMPTVGG